MAVEVVAYITRIGGSTIAYADSVDAVDHTSAGSAYKLRKKDGTHCGFYRSAGDAQRAFKTIIGARQVRWEQKDLPGQIEHYVGTIGQP